MSCTSSGELYFLCHKTNLLGMLSFDVRAHFSHEATRLFESLQHAFQWREGGQHIQLYTQLFTAVTSKLGVTSLFMFPLLSCRVTLAGWTGDKSGETDGLKEEGFSSTNFLSSGKAVRLQYWALLILSLFHFCSKAQLRCQTPTG